MAIIKTKFKKKKHFLTENAHFFHDLLAHCVFLCFFFFKISQAFHQFAMALIQFYAKFDKCHKNSLQLLHNKRKTDDSSFWLDPRMHNALKNGIIVQKIREITFYIKMKNS